VSHTPDASDAEDVERGSTVDSDAPPPAEALDTTAAEDRARAARPQSSSPWAFPPSAKCAGRRNAPNVLPGGMIAALDAESAALDAEETALAARRAALLAQQADLAERHATATPAWTNVLPIVSPPVKKDERKHPRGVGLCIRVIISLLLIINCVFLARIDDGIRTGGVNTNFWTNSSPPLPPPPPPLPPPPPPPPPGSSPTTPTTPSTSGSRTEYKMVSYKPSYFEHFGTGGTIFHEYTDRPFDYATSNSSFIDVVKREGVDNATIFETCLYPTHRVELRTYTGPHHNPGTTYETTYMYVGKAVNQAEVDQVDCVMKKLLNKLAESNWKVHSYHEYSSKHTLLFSGELQQNATSS